SHDFLSSRINLLNRVNKNPKFVLLHQSFQRGRIRGDNGYPEHSKMRQLPRSMADQCVILIIVEVKNKSNISRCNQLVQVTIIQKSLMLEVALWAIRKERSIKDDTKVPAIGALCHVRNFFRSPWPSYILL